MSKRKIVKKVGVFKLTFMNRDNDLYVSRYCNFAHRLRDGKPFKHECRIIPPAALRAEQEDDDKHSIPTRKLPR